MQPRETGRPAAAARAHAFTGKVTARRREKKFSQASLYRPLFTHDQFGRQWFCEIHQRSGMPVSRLYPCFVAPWYPDSTYITVNPENTAQCFIDFPRMRQEKRVAIAAYHADAVGLATEKKWAIPERGVPYPREIVQKLGTPPRAIEPIVAAEQGHPWINGWSQVPDPRLVELVKPKRRLLSVDEEGYDFSEDSYRAAIGASQPVARALTPKPDVEALKQRVIDYEARQSEGAAGADDEDLDDVELEERPGHEAPDAPLVDPTDIDDAFGLEGGPTERTDDRLIDPDAIEDELDPEARGGTRVPVRPKAPAKAASPNRRPQQVSRPAPRTGSTASRLPANRTGKARPTLADGAKPVISD